MKNLITLIIFINAFIVANGFCQQEITVDFNNEIATIKNLLGVNGEPNKKIIGYKETGITTVRVHGDRFSDYQNYTDFWNYDSASDSFTTINTNFDPSDPNQYQWSLFDQKINAIIENGMQVYFRLGISWPLNPNFATPPLTPPLDPDGEHFTKFAELCKRTVMHCNDGWGNGFHHNIQYWEIWNEPGGIFWEGSPLQFYQMFATVSETLKSYNPDLKVGGPGAFPATIVKPKDEYFKSFLHYLSDNNIPLDFYSWHLYGAKNPYGVKYWAQIVRDELDAAGFINAESHITEINYNLYEAGELFEDNPAGATYLLSNLLTVQEAVVDKMFWFHAYALVDDDYNGQPQLRWNAYGMKTFSLIYENTPIQIQTTGSEVIEGNWEADTTNFMVLAAKSESGDKVFLVISNYRSEFEDYDISFNNLPWNSGDQIKITKNIVIGPADKFTETTSYQSGRSTMNVTVRDMPSPSITFLRLEKEIDSGIDNSHTRPEKFRVDQNYPNPFNPTTTIRYHLARPGKVEIAIYNVLGEKIQTLVNEEKQSGAFSIIWDGTDGAGNAVSSGIFYYQLRTDSYLSNMKKMCLLK